MAEEDRFVIEERPETEVYTTAAGYVGIRQRLRGQETVILLTADEAAKVTEYLKNCVAKLRSGN